MEAKIKKKEFIRYDEGAERYSMSKHSFMKLAQEARAVYKINRITLVSVPIFEEYLESFRDFDIMHHLPLPQEEATMPFTRSVPHSPAHAAF